MKGKMWRTMSVCRRPPCPQPQTRAHSIRLCTVSRTQTSWRLLGKRNRMCCLALSFFLKIVPTALKNWNTHANHIMRASVSLIYFLLYIEKGLIMTWKQTNWYLIHIFIWWSSSMDTDDLYRGRCTGPIRWRDKRTLWIGTGENVIGLVDGYDSLAWCWV